MTNPVEITTVAAAPGSGQPPTTSAHPTISASQRERVTVSYGPPASHPERRDLDSPQREHRAEGGQSNDHDHDESDGVDRQGEVRREDQASPRLHLAQPPCERDAGGGTEHGRGHGFDGRDEADLSRRGTDESHRGEAHLAAPGADAGRRPDEHHHRGKEYRGTDNDQRNSRDQRQRRAEPGKPADVVETGDAQRVRTGNVQRVVVPAGHDHELVRVDEPIASDSPHHPPGDRGQRVTFRCVRERPLERRRPEHRARRGSA